jgi:methylated-DNA-protein-cysteine methyltransferase related protein
MARRASIAAVRMRAEVLRLVGLIPPGHFTTYGALAVHMNVAPLFVASVLARMSEQESATLPWHRVVAAGPRISPAMDPELRGEQRRRLETEGLRFDAKGLILDADARFHRVGVRRNVRWSQAPHERGAGDGRWRKPEI